MADVSLDELVARLVAAFPRVQIGAATVAAYQWGLQDLDVDLAERAVMMAIRSMTFFPTIAEIRTIAADLQAAMPDPHAALELVEVYVNTEAVIDCPECDGTGLHDTTDPESLPCLRCRGRGVVRNPDRPDLPGPAARALRIIGGSHGYLASDQTVVRAQFLKAYTEFAAADRRRVVLGPSATADVPSATPLLERGRHDA